MLIGGKSLRNILKPDIDLEDFPGGRVVKIPSGNAGDIRDVDSITGSGKYPGEENSNPHQYSCLKNPLDRGAQ